MRWSIVRVIWLRELRDQLRDRRTMFMIIVLPLLIYPLAGLGLMQFASGLLHQESVIGILGADHLPSLPSFVESNRLRAVTGLTCTGPERLLETVTLAAATQSQTPFPPLLQRNGSTGHFQSLYFSDPLDRQSLRLVFFNREKTPAGTTVLLEQARDLLEARQVDTMLVVPPDFRARLEHDGRPTLFVLSRPDDRSQIARARAVAVLVVWRDLVKNVGFIRKGLPPGFDIPFDLRTPAEETTSARQPRDAILDLLIRVFPFVLVLWSLAGALYPAVDLCAGEKERGTMETLLISPAQREEIVWGKFLAIWVFSGVTALLNLVSMALTSRLFGGQFASDSVSAVGMAWSVLLLLPLSAFFSALCLAVGAYARSTKEGQYYLMPLFLVIMPLLFLTLAPGVELNPFYSMVPVTGVSLLLQQLIRAGTPDPALWLYCVPVLVPMVIYGWLALRWAIIQFQREEVLFREAEKLEIGLWLRRLLRDKEPRPSAGQALFCFTLVLGLSWFSLGLGSELIATNIIRFIAFVAAPTLLMAILLTTQPRQSLAVRLPPAWSWPFAVVLALVVTPPLAELTLFLLDLNPNLKTLVEQYRPFTEWLNRLRLEGKVDSTAEWQALLVFAWLPAICEELTFRGFILTGLQRRFRPRTAVLLSSFLFALLHMNVFTFVPTFLLGVVLAYLTTRCGSILPSMLFHLLYNTLLLLPAIFWPGSGEALVLLGLDARQLHLVALACLPVAVVLLWWLTKLYPHPAYVAFLLSDPGLEPPFDQ
jgi:sodium transport system permease protein